MGDGFHVDTNVLRAHAKETTEVKAKVDQVLDAGKQVTPGGWDNAYGLLCQGFPQATQPLIQLFADGLQTISDYYQRAIEGINADADRYDNVEEEAAQRIQDALTRLESAARAPSVSGGGGTSTGGTGTGGSLPPITTPTEGMPR